MARPRSDTPPVLAEIESLGDRLAHWTGANAALVLAVGAAILIAAAAVGGWLTWADARQDRAAVALAEVDRAYRAALGAAPDAIEITEPANPEVARRAREEAVAGFIAVAEEHAGTDAAAIARLRAAALQTEVGNTSAALETLERALETSEPGSALRGVVLMRLARLHEDQGAWSEAAARYEEAGEVEALPVRQLALVDAARSWAEAGEPDRAVALYERVRQEAPDLTLLPHVEARLEELRQATGAASTDTTP